MVATSKNAAIPEAPAGQPAAGGDGSATPLAEFRTTAGLYALWAVLTTISVTAGRAELAPPAAMVLLIGSVATNAMFFAIAKSPIEYRPPQVTITLAQCVMAITWTTLFSFMSAGTGELAFGMYVTAILFAVSRIRRAALLQLGLFAVACFAGVALVKASLSDVPPAMLPELAGVLVFAGLVGALLLVGGPRPVARPYASDAPRDKDNLTECADLRSSTERSYILDSLEREKGRTDRSNNPFAICVLAVDNIDSVMRDYGSVVGALVLQRFAKRVRGEMRAMDGVHRSGPPRSFDRVGAERYIAVLPQTNLAGGHRCAERIRAAIARYPIDGQYTVTVSGGVVEYRRGESVADLLERAQAELSRALAAGGNCVRGYEATAGHAADVIPLHGSRT